MKAKLAVLIGASILFVSGAAQSKSCKDIDDYADLICQRLNAFGVVIGKLDKDDPSSRTYYFQMKNDYTFPNTNVLMVIQITCSKFANEDKRFFCSTGSASGAPVNFPPAFVIPDDR